MLHADVVELADWVLYDETVFGLGDNRSTTRHLFSVPIGQCDVGCQDDKWGLFVKQFLHTNQLMAGALPYPNAMMVKRLNVLFLTGERPLRLFETSAYRNTYVEFNINRRNYWQSPAWQCASPFVLFDTPKKEIADMEETYGVAWKQIGATFRNGLLINPGEYFTVSVTMMELPEEPLACHAYLDGVERRPIP